MDWITTQASLAPEGLISKEPIMFAKKFLSAALATGSLLLSGAAFAAPTITLNPTANNGLGAAGVIDAAQPSFTTDNILTSFTSVLDISSTSGVGGFNESGALVFTQALLGGLGVTSSFNRYFAGGQYDIYGIFTGVGTGSWLANNYIVSGVSSFNLKLYASPAGKTPEVIGTASSGTDPNGGVTKGPSDLFLGTASFAAITGITSATLLAGNQATEGLQALFNFAPAAGFTGAGGFFAAPIPFVINIGASGSTNSGESTYALLGSGVRITTPFTTPGTANLTFSNRVPEPGALSLVGIALVGMAAARKRKVIVKV